MTYRNLWALALCTFVSVVQAKQINPSTPEGVVAMDRKVHCSLNDGEFGFYTWGGEAYSRVTGEKDRHLFNVQGFSVRQCATVNDPKKGTGYRMVSRELMFYLDPETNNVLREWENPWTGKTVEVVHVANDPVNGRPTFGKDARGRLKPSSFVFKGGRFFLDIVVPLFYKNPMAGDYQLYVGGFYHATEIFHFSGSTDRLLDGDLDKASAYISWVRLAPWLPWMEMSGRQGTMYVAATGYRLDSFEDVPKVIQREIRRNYPQYRTPPPLDDSRPNQTSWTFFKEEIDARTATGQ